MIELKGIRKSFRGTEVLRGVDLTVEEGQTVALIGASGSGKSTLLRCVNLLETPDSGTVRIGDFTFRAGEIPPPCPEGSSAPDGYGVSGL